MWVVYSDMPTRMSTRAMLKEIKTISIGKTAGWGHADWGDADWAKSGVSPFGFTPSGMGSIMVID